MPVGVLPKNLMSNENATVVLRNVYLTVTAHITQEPCTECQKSYVDVFDIREIISQAQGLSRRKLRSHFVVIWAIFSLGLCEPY